MRRRQAFAQKAKEEPVHVARCRSCGRTFASERGLAIHRGRGCK